MNNGLEGPTRITLASMVSPASMDVNVTVASWSDAINKVGELLLNAGKIRKEYIEAMKRVLQEMGPYAVIAPGIVLLHARPEDGVLEPCLGLITLSQPVPFGHSQNDPVDIVLALGAVDKQSHITALQQLGSLLGDLEKLKEIRSARHVSDLVEIFAGIA